MKHRKLLFQILLGVLPIIAIAGLLLIQFGNRPSAVPSQKHTSPILERTYISDFAGHRWLNGVALHRYTDLRSWKRSTGENPDIIAIYTRLNQPFPIYEVRSIVRSGALPLIQLNPRFTSMERIARGALDIHLRKWAASLHKIGVPVAVSFAHEMNGNWETWGCNVIPASLFVRDWRHIHDIIGSSKVIWVWNVNQTWNGSCKMQPLYPGDHYVDWIGIDGYMRNPESTFRSVFGTTLSELRAFTGNKPIFLAETGVPMNHSQPHQIRELYQGALREGLIGAVYFDAMTRKGDYRPQDNPGALRAFRKAISQR